MKIAHISDLHCNRENAEVALKSLTEFRAHIISNSVDLVAISGDIWDASMLNTEASGFDRFVEAIQRIADIAPVVMVYGTPSHDTDGSLEVFKRITSKCGITILEPATPYFLNCGEVITQERVTAGTFLNNELLILGIPEPRKKYLLAGATAGKDETDEAIRGAMHQLCFQLAAVRAEYATLPCLVVYHGDVAGTTLQNDQTIERGTGIAITIDELADIGAQYYALGHIHKPQQVGTLPAYYAGSTYPKNFGEGHKAGFNVVEITHVLTDKDKQEMFTESKSAEVKRTTLIERINFSHPQNLKVEIDFKLKDSSFHDINGRRVWVEINCTKEEKAFVDIDAITKQLLKAGAAEGSRVTTFTEATETVRAAEIAGAVSPEKKLEIWGEQSNIKITASLKKKLKLLEEKSERAGVIASGDWALVSVRLRGSIGIKKGIKKDEIFIDFDAFDPGLIALSGKNGKGKTTLIENCHAYPQLLTRKGTLKDHFGLRDSFREVIYRDEKTNHEKRFLIQIDGATKSGGSKYYIFDRANSASDWIPAPGIDGNLAPYTEAVKLLFGPLELYLRTAFITQRPNKDAPDLTEATITEKKALFTNLAGIDYLQKFTDNADIETKRVQTESHDSEIKIGVMETAINVKGDLLRTVGQLKTEREDFSTQLAKTLADGLEAKNRVDELRKEVEEERKRAQKEADLTATIDQIEGDIGSLTHNIGIYSEASKLRAVYEKDISLYENAQKTEGEELEKQRLLEIRNVQKTTQFRAQMDVFNAKKRKIEQLLITARLGANKATTDAAQIQSTIRLLERDSADFEKNCPTCGQILPADKLAELTRKREEACTRIEAFKVEAEHQNTAIASAEASVDALNAEIAGMAFDEPEAEKAEIFNTAILQEARAVIAKINIALTRDNLTKAAESSARIEGFKAQITDKEKQLTEKTAEREIVISQKPLKYLYQTFKNAEHEHLELQEKYNQTQREIASHDATIRVQESRLTEIEAQETQLGTLKASVEQAKTEYTEWDLLSRAFGKSGIQALELDALSPGIAEIANRILSSAYGDRFRVEFQTTRIGGTGRNTKQIEDFLIFVIDSDDGEQTLLENKSGGEAVWVKRAIYDAFAVIRARNTGFRFLTCFQDETDGALDSDSKNAYARMLEAAHDESHLRHTIIITHSDEVKAMISQKIEMEALAGCSEPVEVQEVEFALEAAV